MKNIILRGLVVFLVLIIASSLLVETFNTEFGSTDFFQVHGIFFLIFITIFPRLTLLLSSVPFGGFLWWAGWVFCPRILVASLATVTYFRTNPVLVVISWLVALSGETAEKVSLGRPTFIWSYGSSTFGNNNSPHQNDAISNSKGERNQDKSQTIEAEFKNLD